MFPIDPPQDDRPGQRPMDPHDLATRLLDDGATATQARDALVAQGVPFQDANCVVDDVLLAQARDLGRGPRPVPAPTPLPTPKAASPSRNMLVGSALFFGCLAALLFLITNNSPPSGVGVFVLGLVWGAIRLYRGFRQSQG
jgi:hypothetical protein